MYLNDDLEKQICNYEQLANTSSKYRYVVDILMYYEANKYKSEKRDRCFHYWRWCKAGLDLLVNHIVVEELN